ncbi:MAG: nucleotidyltransferase domain-containing protein [Thermoprotei archaeon]
MSHDRLSPLKIISQWRKYVDIIYKATRRVIPSARICLTGGVVEDRLTVLSDIDVLVVLDHEPSFSEAVDLRTRIYEEAEKMGLPLYAPVELHIIGPHSIQRYRSIKCFEQLRYSREY